MSLIHALSRTATAAVFAASSILAASSVQAQTIAMQSQLVATGLSKPVGVYAPPGDTSRIFVVEQTGAIRVYSLPDYNFLGVYLDIGVNGLGLSTTITVFGDERGFLGLAFHPDFATNGYFYVNYTAASGGTTTIRRYTANAPFATSTTANTSSGTTLLTVSQPATNHNGGSIRFGPDRMLYIFMGDGGGSDDPGNRSQNDTELLGKILRIDVNDVISNADGDGLYIPNNNPFRSLGNPRDKIWAKGVRNPWQSTFDRATGNLWVADVGQTVREEINFQPVIQLSNPLDGNSTILNAATVASLNYGWDCREGLIECPTAAAGIGPGCDPDAPGYYEPIIDYTHSVGCSITGGFVYRGSAIPALDGCYFYADYCTSTTHRILKYNGSVITFHTDVTDQLQAGGTSNIASITAYGEDAAGELYICRSPNGAGTVYKIVPFAVPCGCPCTATGPQRELFVDSFQTNRGWTTSGVAAGAWVRAQPVNSLSTQWDPMSDADGTGWCALTGNANSNDDVDGGSTTFTSPALDFSLGQISICYSYQFAGDSQNANDGLFVEVSSNGTSGPWTRVASHQTDFSNRWIPHHITSAALATANVTNTANMRVRFIATDVDAISTIDAAVDNFKVLSANVPDCNENDIDDLADITSGTSLDTNSNLIPDECEVNDCACDWDNSGALGVPDIFAFLASWFADAPEADFNGADGRTVADIFAFLACWFAGCP